MTNLNSWHHHCAIALWLRLGTLTAITTAQVLAQFTFTTFDVPGAAGTHPTTINNNGDIAGTYDNGSGGVSGFIRKTDGTYVLFDLSSVNGTVRQVTGINDLDEVAGTGKIDDVAGALGFVGFVRNVDGSITTFSAPSILGPDNGTSYVAGLNNAGESVVEFQNGSAVPSFFLRTSANGYTMLPKPAGDVFSVPFAGLNNSGEAV